MITSSVIDMLKHDGFRMGKIRRAIIEIFELSHKPLSARDIIKKLQKQKSSPNKTSVYRELNFLSQQKIVRIVHVNRGTTYYESSYLDHHHHLICQSCNRIEDVSLEELEKSIQTALTTITKQQQFQIRTHSLEFYGECSNCQL